MRVLEEDAPPVEEEAETTAAEWHAYSMPLDVRSGDGREFLSDGLNILPLPLPMQLMTEESEYGHVGSEIAGSILTAEVVDVGGTKMIYTTGTYARTSEGELTEEGKEAFDLVNSQTLRWVSSDNAAIEWEEFFELDGERVEFDDLDDDDFLNVKVVTVFTKFNFMGHTVLAFPAYPQAVIAPIDKELDVVTQEALAAAAELGAVVACGYEGDPPASAFDDPKLSQLTPLTITDDGRVYGHIAGWNIAHIGYPGERVLAPHSKSHYAYFRTGVVRTSEGTEIPVGQLTVGAGHAESHLDHRAAASHYDNTAAAYADVSCGEDDHGIWVAGVVRPEATPQQIRQARAAPPSGDWRPIGGSRELVAALHVNVPGFPTPRIGMAASANGEPEFRSLVAAGVVTRHKSTRDLRKQLTNIETALAPFISERAREIAQRFKK